MANEINITSKIGVTGASASDFSLPSFGGSYQVDQTAGGGGTPGFVNIGTTEESFTFPELTTLGFLWIFNHDATNFIKWGFSTGVYGGRVNPLEPAGPFRLEPGTTLYTIANTAACKAFILALEN